MQRALAAEARSYSAKIGELDKRTQSPRASDEERDVDDPTEDGGLADDRG